MTPVVEQAKKLAASGFMPVPLVGKVPTLEGWQQAAVPDDATIDGWCHDGKLRNVGLRTGDNGLVVLDFDGLAGYQAFVQAFGPVADTRTVATGGGDGMHVYYRVLGDLPKSTGQLPVPGGKVEIKAAGRQVVVPPSIHPDTGAFYEYFNKASTRELQSFAAIQAWIDSFKPVIERRETEAVATAQGAKSAYARAALTNVAADLAAAKTERNIACNRAAWKLAHFAARGDLTKSEIRSALESAMTANGYIASDGLTAFEKTFESGFEDGLGDRDYVPQCYQADAATPRGEQRRELPGKPAYTPPPVVRDEGGVTTIGRTRLIKRTDLFVDLTKRIFDDDYVPGVPPVMFPLRCLHGLGGQARVTRAGKVIALVGASGSGKTSALETIADAYVEEGVPVWMWTPEWTPDEMAERVVQRYGGPTQDELYLHEIDKWRVKSLNQTSNPAHRLTTDHEKRAAAAMRKVRSWSTDVSFVENSLMTVYELAEVIAAARSIVTPFPRVLIVDYVQLLKANEVDEKDDTSMYNLVQRFKALCVYHGLIGVMSTQTTKEQAGLNVKQGEFLGTTVLNVSKNSRGDKGKVRVPSDPAHLRLIDDRHPNQTFRADDHYLGSQAGRFINDDAFNLFVTLNPEHAEVV